MVATQFHPEFKSRPLRPHPLVRDFIGAALDYKESRGAAPESVSTGVSGAVSGGGC